MGDLAEALVFLAIYSIMIIRMLRTLLKNAKGRKHLLLCSLMNIACTYTVLSVVCST